jgi:hypothetical protein
MTRKKFVNIVILIVVLTSLGLSGYFYYQLHRIKTNFQIGVKEEAKNLVDKVSRLYLIPNDEEPTIATVSDPAILKEQSFFTQAEKDDKVLIFSKTGKAILYRPSIDKIIEIVFVKNTLEY